MALGAALVPGDEFGVQGLVERLIERRLQVIVAPPPHVALLDLDCVPLLFVMAFDRLHDELLSEVEGLDNRLEPGRADERTAAREIAEQGRFDSFNGVMANSELNTFFGNDLKTRMPR